MQRFATFVILSLAAASCGGGGGQYSGKAAPPSSVRADTALLLADRIARCSRLATTEYSLHKIVTFDDKIFVSGKLLSRPFRREVPVGDRKIAIPIDVTLRGYIDFADFGEENIKRHGAKITITLPDPVIVVSSSKIDHQGIRKAVGPLRSDFSAAEVENYTRQGIDSIEKHIRELGIIETSRVNAARALVPVVAGMGYEERNITINFRPTDGGNVLRRAGAENR